MQHSRNIDGLYKPQGNVVSDRLTPAFNPLQSDVEDIQVQPRALIAPQLEGATK